jgi:flagellar biosynthesis protein FlhA
MAEPDIVGKGSRSEILMGFGVMALLFVLVIPLPGFMIDGLIAVNLAVATLVMLITLAAREPLELSTYPTILLLTTLFRLALNVASSRMILLKGDAGDVIHAFGMFVVGGDLVVGITIFAIIIIIQFVVITKGSSRISEVAARFTLDAMPGKQMAIDADLTAGTITESDARTRREKVGQEAEFYGAMDGAGKFVRGDAVAGLIITVVNIVGGATIGMLEKDMGLGEALKKYAILTIGDGLVTQTPALIIAVASGMLVTKTSSKEKFADEFGSQMTRDRRAMGISAAVVSMLAFLPGFPALPFLTMGGILAAFWRGGKVKTPAEAAAGEDAGSATKPETGELTAEALTKLLQVDRLGVEVGFRLISMVDGSRPGGLLDHIASVRRQFAQSHGIIVPPIRLKDNITMEPNAYRILIAGQEVARGTIYPNNYLAMNPGHVAEPIAGVKTTDPTFGLPAVWVRDDKKVEAEALGYTVVDANTVLVTHLSETLKSHAHEILTRDDVGALIDKYKAHSPAVVNELIPEILHLGDVQRVLQNLLLERIPVRNLGAILECLADNGRKVKDVDQLTELVRQRIGRTLCELVQGRDGILRAIVVDPEVETHIDDALAGRDGAEITPDMVKEFQESAAKTYVEATRRGFDPFVLVRATVRRYVVDLLSGASPRIPVLSFGEVSSARQIEPCGQISFPVESRKLLGATA